MTGAGTQEPGDRSRDNNSGFPRCPDFLWSFMGSRLFMRLSSNEKRTR
jgi:hypothetical protein